MIGIDTNLLVRLLTNDDVVQARYAKKLIEENMIFISKGVLLETEWVLRYTYELSSNVIHKAFESLLGLARITVEDPACIIKTMQWYNDGFDFADAMHLASSIQIADQFATLDKVFIKRAKKIKINLITME
jgi:predicted nucleic-acid-binding protein